jgi:hypothetical protein
VAFVITEACPSGWAFLFLYAILLHAVIALNRFFEGPAYQRDTLEDNWQIILWWGKRRLHFNMVLAVVGLIMWVLMTACALASEPLLGVENGLPDPPIFVVLGVAAYAIIANICYTGGWISELLVGTWKTSAEASAFGHRAFRRGMQFSICLTLFPAVLSWALLLVRVAAVHRSAPSP